MIYREAAYIAYHFNWSKREILEMTHKERRRWITEIADINRKINEASKPKETGQKNSPGALFNPVGM